MIDQLIGILFWLAVLVGHIGIWCLIFNRTHATAWPRKWRKIIEKAIILVVLGWILGLPLMLLLQRSLSVVSLIQWSPAVGVYAMTSAFASIFFFVAWVIRNLFTNPPENIRCVESKLVVVADELKRSLIHGNLAMALGWIPGNQVTDLSFETRKVFLPNNRAERTIRVCQLSDFHLTGQVDIAFFRYLIDQVNAWQPDVVFITGDLVDETECLEWIQPIFEPLRPPFGAYYLLGNHDRRMPSESELRERLSHAGLIRAGGRWHELKIAGQDFLVAGNELPWFDGAERLEPRFDSDAIRLLLTHSPDQIDWARRFDFDWILAGHTHGGQIRLPVIGPIISPSKYGVKYAGGSFRVNRSLMHVSRGICGDEPIRWNCAPEVSLFLLPAAEMQSE